ncbi:MAG: SMP-30/gluconolactonase/LRE family protein, partial [Thermodesulfobacteriota bacterium]|nr:SMP-30/gluconolactonase/LRE family protein [Thermodesulfobacteriota bacterium]
MITKVNKCLNLCVSIAVILIALIFPPTPALSEEPYVFERMWPTLQQPWYFNPAGIATDKNGNIYVINFAYISTIKKFSADGQFITEWGESGTGNGQFRQPTAIEIGGNGNVYVVDAGNHRIQKFTSDGQFISKWGGEGSNNGQFKLNSPSASDYCYEGGISIGPNNNVYVADTFNHRIQKFNSNGLFISAWGSEGLDDGQFDQPIGIAVDRSGNVYVVDAGNHRIQKFTSDGQFLTKWGSTGSGDGEFDFKGGECILGRISTDESGNIYVSDHNNHRIQKFTSDGRFITKWGEFGSGDGELIYPTGITTDGKNNIYVCDGNNFRIQKFTSNGQFITKWGSTGSGDGEFFYPSGITVDGGNNVYVADTGNGRIQKFASDGRFITKWDAGCSVGIAVSKSGYVYVADSCNHCIQKFTSDGQFTTKWGSEGSADGEFNFGNHYIGMAIDGNGNIYVVDFGNHCIQKFTSDGRFIAKWGSEGSADGEFNFGNYLHPSGVGVAVDENDYVYVADRVNHRVQKFTSDGQFITKWGNEGSADGESWYPIAIAIDKSENVYVVDENNRIQVFTSDGQFITKFGEFGSTAGQLAAPFGICVSASNRVYVADTLNARIQVFSRKDDTIKISKAIIVAGGGPFIGNNIWDATEMCANYAYRALTYQGFTKDTIYYLSSDTDL